MLGWINEYVFGTTVPLLLMLAGIYYAVRLGFFFVRRGGAIWRALTEKDCAEGVSPAKALSLALAGTLGVGNIVGVSAAIAVGGFGSIFWMWVSALCAMVLKYAEIVLAMLHRRYDEAGNPHGGASYYIRDGLGERGHAFLGSLLAGAFACLCIMNSVTMGSIVQVSAVTHAFSGVFHIPPLVTGGAVALLTFLTLRRGSERVLSLTGRLVPLMTLGYLILSVAVLILRTDAIGDAFSMIFRDAFRGSAAVGGIGGFLLSDSVRLGTMRGLVSNEAGCGTAPTAHAVSSCSSPAKQGVWGIFEVFADTILLCTVTALVIIIGWSELGNLGDDYMMMTIRAYEVTLGPLAAYFMSIAVLFFGFATVVCWGHYGMESVAILSERPAARRLFILIYVGSVFVGAFAEAGLIWDLADFAVGAMCWINVSVLCLMSGDVKRETDLWLAEDRATVRRRRARKS